MKNLIKISIKKKKHYETHLPLSLHVPHYCFWAKNLT